MANKHKSTETIGRCTIQERSVQIDGQDRKRWVVTWTANSEAQPVRIVCAVHHAALALADVLSSRNVLWPCES